MKTLKVKEELFVPWILEEYTANELYMEALEDGSSTKQFALDVAGLMPINHIQNWEEVKQHFSEEDIEGDYIEEWSDFKIEWV
jgi:hypothetical protein